MLCLLSSALVAISLSVANAASHNNQMTLDEAKSINFHRHRRSTIDVFAMNDKISTLMKELEGLKSQIEGNASMVSDHLQLAQDDLNDAKSEMRVSIKESKKNVEKSVQDATTSMNEMKDEVLDQASEEIQAVKAEVEATMQQLKKDVLKNSSQIESNVEDAVKSMQDTVSKANSQMTKALSDGLSAINKKITDEVSAVQGDITDPKIHMWSGGSRGHSRGNGWAEFVLDRIEYDTAKPYFEKQTNTRWRALKDGLFRVRWNFMHYTHNTCYRHSAFYVAGRHVIAPQHRHQYHWQEAYLEVTWHIKKNQQFWFSALTSCGNPYRWHAGGSWSDAYNRAQIQYVGQFASKCSGTNQGLC